MTPLENFEEQDLIDLAEQGNQGARNRLIESYLPMVLNIAREKGRKKRGNIRVHSRRKYCLNSSSRII